MLFCVCVCLSVYLLNDLNKLYLPEKNRNTITPRLEIKKKQKPTTFILFDTRARELN